MIKIKKEYNLEKHPEGGWFVEVYTSPSFILYGVTLSAYDSLKFYSLFLFETIRLD